MSVRSVPANLTGYIPFKPVAQKRCGTLCLYAARHLTGAPGNVALADDLRWFGSIEQHLDLMIHADDADVFVARFREHQIGIGSGWHGEPSPTVTCPNCVGGEVLVRLTPAALTDGFRCPECRGSGLVSPSHAAELLE